VALWPPLPNPPTIRAPFGEALWVKWGRLPASLTPRAGPSIMLLTDLALKVEVAKRGELDGDSGPDQVNRGVAVGHDLG
jgi:hypothetical protein